MDGGPAAGLVERLEKRLTAARDRRAAERDALDKARKKVTDLTEAQALVQRVAAAVQEAAHRNLSAVVTEALKAVGYDYEFAFRFERKRGRTEARPVFVRGGREVSPLRGAGLGPVDVAAFALRVAALVFQTPARRRLVVLDEPFKHASARGGFRDRIRGMIEKISKDLEVQIVMVTHSDELVAGDVVDLT